MWAVTVKRLSVVWILVLVSCSGARPPETTVESYTWEVAGLQERGMLLLLEDRRQFDPFAVQMTRRADTELRVDLAEALGRVGDPRGLPTLQELLVDPEAVVRRAAAFGLGLLGDAGGIDPLLRAVTDPDRNTGARAVASLARLEADFQQVIVALQELPPEESWPRLLPSLFRYPNHETFSTAQRGLALERRDLRKQAFYSLARNPLPEAAPLLRPFLQDPDPWVRGWAARALGQVGDGRDLDLLRPLLGDETTPVIQALRAGRSLIERGESAPPEAWIAELLRLMRDPDPGIAITAIESAAAWLLDDALADALVELVAAGTERQREVAFLALAAGGDSRGAALLQPLLQDVDPKRRALAAAAASELGMRSTLEVLLQDEDHGVRLAAITGVVDLEPDSAGGSIAQVVADSDPAVRGTALDWAAGHPEIPVELLEQALAGPPRQPVELYLNGTAALLARALTEPLERGEIVRILEELSARSDYPVRVQAGLALEALGRPRPDLAPSGVRRTAATYRELIRRAARPRFAELRTRHGVARLELDCPTAPLTCLNFLQLVNQGFYDGLEFHRVVPDFVIQGGDPRGDGWGGPGYTIRDELNAKPFDTGVVGMALAGADTGGSQFFITLSPQPHLDAGFTAFGSVVDGLDVLGLIEQGDRIDRLVEVPARR
ncbi:MAG: peptidylprolyl isomerase [Thermoanaerobaculia bacterium]